MLSAYYDGSCDSHDLKHDVDAQRAYLDFLKDLFKGRTYVKVAYVTGILPIKKYGTHSALNIFDEFSMTSPGKLAKYVGFTESEVKRLCKTYSMEFEEAQKWYDGYMFKQIGHIYNPKSIIDAMIEEDFKSYWTSTETYEALQVYIDLDEDGLKQAIIPNQEVGEEFMRAVKKYCWSELIMMRRPISMSVL